MGSYREIKRLPFEGNVYNNNWQNYPLCNLNAAKFGAIEQHWIAQVDPFDFEVHYHPGGCNTAADTLSR